MVLPARGAERLAEKTEKKKGKANGEDGEGGDGEGSKRDGKEEKRPEPSDSSEQLPGKNRQPLKTGLKRNGRYPC